MKCVLIGPIRSVLPGVVNSPYSQVLTNPNFDVGFDVLDITKLCPLEEIQKRYTTEADQIHACADCLS